MVVVGVNYKTTSVAKLNIIYTEARARLKLFPFPLAAPLTVQLWGKQLILAFSGWSL